MKKRKMLVTIIICVIMCFTIKCNDAQKLTGKLVCNKMLVPQFALFQDEIMQKNKTVTFNETNKYTNHSIAEILFDHRIPRLAEITYSDLTDRTLVDDDTLPEEEFDDNSRNLTEDVITFRNGIRQLRDSKMAEIDALRANLVGDDTGAVSYTHLTLPTICSV